MTTFPTSRLVPSTQQVVSKRSIVTLIALSALMLGWFRPDLGAAQPSDTFEDGFAFSTAATGLILTGGNDLQVESDRERIDEDKFEDDPGAGTAGFIVVAEGTVLVSEVNLGSMALLGEGDALFVPRDLNVQIEGIDDDARIWRISLSAEDDLPGDTDAVIPGDPNADGAARRPVSFRTGLVDEGVTATMGEDDEQVPLVYSIAGDAHVVDGDDVDEGDSGEGQSNQVESIDEAAFIGFLAIGPARAFDGSEPRPQPTPTAVIVTGGGSSDGGNNGGGQEPPPELPTNTPEPTATPTELPTATPSPTPELVVDTDSDGLSDTDEVALGTDPNNQDSDADGISDGREVNALGTNPLDTDTDSDGLTDGLELDHSCDPNAPDTDADGLGDAFEANSGFSECSLADTDGDGDDDLAEFSIGTDPRDPNCFSGPGSVCQN
jgi:Bacterial TSP3 repeat